MSELQARSHGGSRAPAEEDSNNLEWRSSLFELIRVCAVDVRRAFGVVRWNEDSTILALSGRLRGDCERR